MKISYVLHSHTHVDVMITYVKQYNMNVLKIYQ